MALIDELRRMYGMGGGGADPLAPMLSAQVPEPPRLDMNGLDDSVSSATSSDMTQPGDLGAGPAGGAQGHPDVLSFLKELDQSGRLTGGKGPEAPKGMQATQTTIKSEQGGIPADVRAQGVAVRGQAELDDAQVDYQRRMKEADDLEQRAAYLRQDVQVEQEKRQQQEAELAKKQGRLRDQQMELAQQVDEPINPNRYFEQKSLAGKASAVISAAIYGYLGGRGQPPVMESLMQMAQADTQAQIANNAASRDKRNTLIQQYERQYGDTTLVAKRLEADKLLEMSKEARAQSMDAKSQEAKAAAEDLQKKLQNRVGVLHQEIQEATYGKPVEVATVYQQPKPRGAGVDPMKAAAEVVASGEKAGYSQDAIAAELKRRGLPVPTGQSAYQRDQGLQEQKARDLSPEAKTDVRKRVDGIADMVQGLTELDAAVGFKRGADGEVTGADEKKLGSSIRGTAGQVGQAFSRALPFGMDKGASEMMGKLAPEDAKALDRARDKIVFAKAQAQGQGALAGPDVERYRQLLPTDSPASLQRASAELWRDRRQQYDNLVGQYGKAAVDEALRARGVNPSELGG